MGALQQMYPVRKKLLITETLPGRRNSTILNVKGIQGRVPGHALCQKRRIVSIATGHIDENPGHGDIRFQQHMRHIDSIFQWIPFHINHFPSFL